MHKLLFAIALIVSATSAQATGGFVCRTAGANPIQVSVGFGHVPGSPLILSRLTDDGRNVPVKPAQWWLDNDELRLVLIDPEARSEQVKLKAGRNLYTYDGSLWRNGQRRWVRCRES